MDVREPSMVWNKQQNDMIRLAFKSFFLGSKRCHLFHIMIAEYSPCRHLLQNQNGTPQSGQIGLFTGFTSIRQLQDLLRLSYLRSLIHSLLAPLAWMRPIRSSFSQWSDWSSAATALHLLFRMSILSPTCIAPTFRYSMTYILRLEVWQRHCRRCTPSCSSPPTTTSSRYLTSLTMLPPHSINRVLSRCKKMDWS